MDSSADKPARQEVVGLAGTKPGCNREGWNRSGRWGGPSALMISFHGGLVPGPVAQADMKRAFGAWSAARRTGPVSIRRRYAIARQGGQRSGARGARKPRTPYAVSYKQPWRPHSLRRALQTALAPALLTPCPTNSPGARTPYVVPYKQPWRPHSLRRALQTALASALLTSCHT